MRNVWMLIIAVLAIGGAVYYWFPKTPAHPEISITGNPLLAASRAQFEQWVPLYPIPCGAIVFEKVDTASRNFNFCIGEIQSRVAHETHASLRREDVLDQQVRAHWHAVMGGQ